MSYIEDYIKELNFPSTAEDIKVSVGRLNNEHYPIHRGSWVEVLHISSNTLIYKEGLKPQKDLLKDCLIDLMNQLNK